MKKLLLSVVFLGLTFSSIAQSGWFTPLDMKGTLNFYWGYNRSMFSGSDIHFKGDNYNFTLDNVQAIDKVAALGVDPYLTATGFTIPQYNYRFGYFISSNWNLTIGMDHMKYVMVQDQTVNANGYIIDNEVRKDFENEIVVLTEDVLTYEHTDGLNYLSVEAEYFYTIYRFSEKYAINALAGGGGGALIPKSNVQLMGYERSDEFHVAGFGLSAKLGLSVNLFKFLFLQTELKGGYINMPDVLVSPGDNNDRASQDFFFTQWNFVIGGYIPLGKK